MNFSRMTRYKLIYLEFLPIFLVPTVITGFVAGLPSVSERNTKSIDYFVNIIGYTSVGLISGLTYPISCPLLAGYVLYNNSKKG